MKRKNVKTLKENFSNEESIADEKMLLTLLLNHWSRNWKTLPGL